MGTDGACGLLFCALAVPIEVRSLLEDKCWGGLDRTSELVDTTIEGASPSHARQE
jgi:hypothetical protein